MSSIPKIEKSKYNHDNKFRWVDSQLEKFMIRQKELEAEIVNLKGKLKNDNEYIKSLEDTVKELKESVVSEEGVGAVDGRVRQPELLQVGIPLRLAIAPCAQTASTSWRQLRHRSFPNRSDVA